jgi:hypothetical protein
MLSIGGITYTSYWDTALSTNPTQFGIQAAQLAHTLVVGIEIDYENSSSPNITGFSSSSMSIARTCIRMERTRSMIRPDKTRRRD